MAGDAVRIILEDYVSEPVAVDDRWIYLGSTNSDDEGHVVRVPR